MLHLTGLSHLVSLVLFLVLVVIIIKKDLKINKYRYLFRKITLGQPLDCSLKDLRDALSGLIPLEWDSPENLLSSLIYKGPAEDILCCLRLIRKIKFNAGSFRSGENTGIEVNISFGSPENDFQGRLEQALSHVAPKVHWKVVVDEPE